MKFEYYPKGVCSSKYVLDINEEDDTINEIQIQSGCAGNLLGISKLIKGMKVQDVIEDFKGTPCGFKSTSCPDQISKALEYYLDNK